ncbi:EexN family lipoprotein, partial [Salmonella enterica]|nr:EexN family lipoprotein [Salmonella enterica]
MKKLFVLSGALLAASLLTGCEEETKSPQWWFDHPKEATEKYQDC